MASYSIANYTISIDNDGKLHVVTREGNDTVDTYNLNEENVKITKDDNNVAIIGTSDIGDIYASSTGLNDNEVIITTSAVLYNIGNEEGINLAENAAFVKRNGNDLVFYSS